MRRQFLVVLAFALAISGPVVAAKTFPLASSASTPAASGSVDVHKDKNGNMEVTIKTEHLAQPGMLTPPATAYVVWFQDQTGQPANQGQLKVDKSLKSEFKTTTPMQNFDVLITAESDVLAKMPSGEALLKAKVQGAN